MSNIWTKSQSDAIQAQGGSIIVSAAAGSGKTAVLVERVIRLITDERKNIPADSLLVVTYTKAAASELRFRLARAIADRLKDDPSNRFLLSQQIRLQNANISTVHSFCSRTVREFFNVIDIDRDFRIADEGELTVLRSDAMKMTLDTLYSEQSDGFLSLLDVFSSDKDDRRLSELIMNIYDFLLSHPFPDRWMDEKLKLYDESDVDSLIWFKEIILPYTGEALTYLSRLYDVMESALSSCDEELYIKLQGIVEGIKQFLDITFDAYDKGDYSLINRALNSFVKTRMPSLSKYKDDCNKLQIQNAKKKITTEVEKLQKLYAFSEDNVKEDVKILKRTASALFDCVKLFLSNFDALKKNRRVADYSDLEHYMIKLLYTDEYKISQEAHIISERFSQILVDEYQDANETQEYIFRALSKGDNEENLFVVGDMKQSIYGFRLAMPEMFKNRRQKAKRYDSEKSEFPACIILEKNFRSARVILDLVNFYFRHLMSETVGDIEYNDDEKLIFNEGNVSDNESSVEFDLIDFEKTQEKNESICEAKFIAKRIKEIMNSGACVYTKKDGVTEKRQLRYSDFAVLMRSESRYSPIYVETLIKHGIPAFSKKSSSFLKSYEIMIMTNLLRVIDNPTLDLELLSVLMSPIYGFTSDDMAKIRLTKDRRHSSLYDCMKQEAASGDEKCIHFLSELDYYREVCVTMLLGDFISLIYDRTSFIRIMSAMSESNLPSSNLRLLLSYARDFQNNTHKGLQKFISYLDNLLRSDKDLQGGVDLDSGSENAVRVMSVHNSKGLEFPVVFLANTKRKFISDAGASYLFDSKYGFAVKRKDIEKNAVFDTLPYLALKMAKKKSEMSEELRILYVALTRAKQKMIIVSTVKPERENQSEALDKSIQSAGDIISMCRKIEPFSVRNVSSGFYWLVMCALMHKDGKVLRDRCPDADIHIDPFASFDFDINIIEDVISVDTGSSAKEAGSDSDDDRNLGNILKERSTFKYRYEKILDLPSNLTVTEIAHRNPEVDFERVLNVPLSLKGAELNAAQKGTAFHRFIQYADFEKAMKDVESEIKRLESEGYLTKSQADSIDRKKAGLFFESDIIKRAVSSDKMYREYKFNVRLHPRIIDESYSFEFEDERITLSGCVDLAFLEDEKLVIVDYKTDRVKNLEKIREMYTQQLYLYKVAMQNITGYPVRETLIYSVYNSETIKV